MRFLTWDVAARRSHQVRRFDHHGLGLSVEGLGFVGLDVRGSRIELRCFLGFLAIRETCTREVAYIGHGSSRTVAVVVKMAVSGRAGFDAGYAWWQSYVVVVVVGG